MDPLRGLSIQASPPPRVAPGPAFSKTLPPPPPPADRMESAPTSGSADWFREMARMRLEATSPNPSPSLVELTALQMAEQRFLQYQAPVPQVQPKVEARGMLGSNSYLATLTACQLGVPPSLAPTMMSVLSDLDPFKIFGPRQENGNNAFIIAGFSLEQQVKASQAAGTVASLSCIAVPLSGILDPREARQVDAAFAPLVRNLGADRVKSVVKQVHVQTVLGELLVPGKNWTMAGLGGSGTIAVSRDTLLRPEGLAESVAHEAGHLLDEELGPRYGKTFLVEAPHSPFGKGQSTTDFRSEYATLNPREDFAEAHADFTQNFDKYQKFPELCMGLRGLYGEKLAFIAREVYGMNPPPLSLNLQKLQQDVHSGRSPFGYFDESGVLVKAQEQLEEAMKAYTEAIGPNLQLSPDFLGQCPPHQKSARQWLFNAIYNHPNEPVKAMSVEGMVRSLQEVSLAEGALQANPADVQAQARKTEASNGCLFRLSRGGLEFFNATERAIAALEPGHAQILKSWLHLYQPSALAQNLMA